MDYKTVLTAMTKDDVGRRALAPAIDFSAAHGAHLEALCSGIDHAYPAYHYGSASLEVLQMSQDQAREEAVAVRKQVTAAIDEAGVEGTARAVVAGFGGIADVLADRGRLADIAVLPQPHGDERPRLHEIVIEAALFAADLPVLIMPAGVAVEPLPRRCVVGWDDGPQALAASAARCRC